MFKLSQGAKLKLVKTENQNKADELIKKDLLIFQKLFRM